VRLPPHSSEEHLTFKDEKVGVVSFPIVPDFWHNISLGRFPCSVGLSVWEGFY